MKSKIKVAFIYLEVVFLSLSLLAAIIFYLLSKDIEYFLIEELSLNVGLVCVPAGVIMLHINLVMGQRTLWWLRYLAVVTSFVLFVVTLKSFADV